MVRLAISVEGATEERFIKIVMVPFLQDKGIYAVPIQLGSTGGNVCIPRIKRDLNNLVHSFDKISTLYDFYGFKDKDKTENKESLEQKILECVETPFRNQIIPYIQMYEFEGLLFTSPEAIENNIQQRGLAKWAKDILQQFANDPEKINNSEQTAPSKRLDEKTDYKKTVHGPDIAKEIGLETLREKCKGFDAWLEKLEELNPN